MALQNTFHGPLRHNPANPRYFTDDAGQAIYLTGSHTWASLMEIKLAGGSNFDYAAWLNFMHEHHHNCMRLWTWDHSEMAPWTTEHLYFEPMPFVRPGPTFGSELALDGQPKYDLSQYNAAYFERLRERVILAGERGIYVAVMLFEGWCLKWAVPESDPWPYHPYHAANNINGVNGDTDNDGKGDVYSLESPAVLEYQKAYIRKVIDTLNDLDNVLWEIANEVENTDRAFAWSYHMVEYVREYERTKPKQHPVGMTAESGAQYNPIIFASPADWVSPGAGSRGEYRLDPPEADGAKVILNDTDHLWGHGGTYPWAWKCFLRGLNPLFMDPWEPVPGSTMSNYAGASLNRRDYPDWALLRQNLGYTRRFAGRMDLNAMRPRSDLAASRYCLANPGREYIVYFLEDGQGWVEATSITGELQVEWFSPRTGETVTMPPIRTGQKRLHFISPMGMDAVLFLHQP